MEVNLYSHRENLLKYTPPSCLYLGTEEENYFGLLLNKEGTPIIAMEGGSEYLSKKRALEIHAEDPDGTILLKK